MIWLLLTKWHGCTQTECKLAFSFCRAGGVEVGSEFSKFNGYIRSACVATTNVSWNSYDRLTDYEAAEGTYESTMICDCSRLHNSDTSVWVANRWCHREAPRTTWYVPTWVRMQFLPWNLHQCSSTSWACDEYIFPPCWFSSPPQTKYLY